MSGDKSGWHFFVCWHALLLCKLLLFFSGSGMHGTSCLAAKPTYHLARMWAGRLVGRWSPFLVIDANLLHHLCRLFLDCAIVVCCVQGGKAVLFFCGWVNVNPLSISVSVLMEECWCVSVCAVCVTVQNLYYAHVHLRLINVFKKYYTASNICS